MAYLDGFINNPKPCIIREAYYISSWAIDGATFLDIGGFVGSITYHFLQKKPKNRAIIFEPVVDSYNAITRRFAGDERVVCINKAVSDTTGTTDLFIRPGKPSCSSMMNRRMIRTSVPTVCLDDWGADKDNIDIIKIDVEGAEHLVLRGARKFIGRLLPTIFLEYHGSNYGEISTEMDYLFSLGYERFVLPRAHTRVCIFRKK